MSITISPSSSSIPFDASGTALTAKNLQEAIVGSLSREAHIGTQPASSISDFDTQVDARIAAQVTPGYSFLDGGFPDSIFDSLTVIDGGGV